MDEIPGLGHQGFDHRGVTMAQVPDPEGGAAVDVFVPLVVPEGGHRTTDEGRLPFRCARELEGPNIGNDHAITVRSPSSARSTGTVRGADALKTRVSRPA